MEFLTWGGLATLVLPVATQFLYGIFLSQREQATRDWLRRRKSGLLKHWYVHIFVQAVRRGAEVRDTQILVSLNCMIPFVAVTMSLLGYTLFDAAGRLDSNPPQPVRDMRKVTPSRGPFPIEEAEGYTISSPSTNEHVSKHRASLQKSRNLFFAALIASVAWWFFCIFLWSPYMIYRRRFEVELSRFMQRIQMLSSKAELSKITEAESRVTDEATAMAFVCLISEVAARHSISSCVEPFLLWKGVGDMHESKTNS